MLDIIQIALRDLELRLHRDLIEEISEEAEEVSASADPELMLRFRGMVRQRIEQIRKLIALGERQRTRRRRLEVRLGGLAESMTRTGSDWERTRLLEDFVSEAVPGDADRDREAIRRGDLDLDAAEERARRIIDHTRVKEAIIIRTVAVLVARMVTALRKDEEVTEADLIALFEVTGVVEACREAMSSDRPWTARAGLQAIEALVDALGPSDAPDILGSGLVDVLRERGMEGPGGPWVRGRAAQLAVRLDPPSAPEIARSALAGNGKEVDPVVRASLVSCLTEAHHPGDHVDDLRNLFTEGEPSETVRMAAARTLGAIEGPEADRLLVEIAVGGAPCDRSPRVRAEAVTAWTRRAIERPDRERAAGRLIAWVVVHDPAPVVRRVALQEAARFAEARQKRLKKFKIDPLDKMMIDAIGRLVTPKTEPRLRKAAEAAREAICVRNLPAFEWIAEEIVEPLRRSNDGRLTVPRSDFKVPDDQLGRILAFLTRDDLGIYVRHDGRAYRFVRGEQRGFRLWRLLHELVRPTPGKARGTARMQAPAPWGTIRVPPGRMAEAGDPGVPGARRLVETDGSWRRWLPSVDDALTIVSPLGPETIRIFSTQGETRLRRVEDAGFLAPWLRLLGSYAEMDALRSEPALEGGVDPARTYLRRLREEFGVACEFRPYTYRFNRKDHRLENAPIQVLYGDAHRVRATEQPEGPDPGRTREKAGSTTSGGFFAPGVAGASDEAAPAMGGPEDLARADPDEAFPAPMGGKEARDLIARILHGREADRKSEEDDVVRLPAVDGDEETGPEGLAELDDEAAETMVRGRSATDRSLDILAMGPEEAPDDTPLEGTPAEGVGAPAADETAAPGDLDVRTVEADFEGEGLEDEMAETMEAEGIDEAVRATGDLPGPEETVEMEAELLSPDDTLAAPAGSLDATGEGPGLDDTVEEKLPLSDETHEAEAPALDETVDETTDLPLDETVEGKTPPPDETHEAEVPGLDETVDETTDLPLDETVEGKTPPPDESHEAEAPAEADPSLEADTPPEEEAAAVTDLPSEVADPSLEAETGEEPFDLPAEDASLLADTAAGEAETGDDTVDLPAEDRSLLADTATGEGASDPADDDLLAIPGEDPSLEADTRSEAGVEDDADDLLAIPTEDESLQADTLSEEDVGDEPHDLLGLPAEDPSLAADTRAEEVPAEADPSLEADTPTEEEAAAVTDLPSEVADPSLEAETGEETVDLPPEVEAHEEDEEE